MPGAADQDPSITVATWNTEWAGVRGARAAAVRDRLKDTAADVLVVTEGRRGLLPEGGHVVDGGDDWGYGRQPDRRKVLLRSRWPLTDVTRLTTGGGCGRVVGAITETPVGMLRVLAVCIPWSRAHVSTGRRDATPWSEHLDCLDQIDSMTTGFGRGLRTIVAGDLNQKIPRHRQKVAAATRLAEVLDGVTVHTAGDVEHGPLIDHVASDFSCRTVRTWPGYDGAVRLSDHPGVVCELIPRRGA